MADRQTIIDTCKSYVMEAQRTQALGLIQSLVDPVVISVGQATNWRYLAQRQAYTVNASTTFDYDFPAEFNSIEEVGVVTDGKITQHFFPMTRARYARDNLSLSSDVSYILEIQPLSRTLPAKFRIINPPSAGTAFQFNYYRKPHKDDINRIQNDLLVVFGVLRRLPPEYLPPKADFEGWYLREQMNEQAKDQLVEEAFPILDMPERTKRSNEFISDLT